MNNKAKWFLTLAISPIFLVALCLVVVADTLETEWRMLADYPMITFNDAEGNVIALDNEGPISDQDTALSYTSSEVQYKDQSKVHYSSVDLTFSCVDYGYRVTDIYDENEPSGIKTNLPNEELFLAEMRFAGKNYIADVENIICRKTKNGYLQVDFTFEEITPFDDLTKEAEIYLQYVPRTVDGGLSSHLAKGTFSYTFQGVQVIDLKEEPEDEETINLEVKLPTVEKDESIRTTTPYVLIDGCTIGDDQSSVTAGSNFQLTLDCRNSHKKMDLDNVLLQVDAPVELKLQHPSNTFHIGNVKEMGSFQKKLNFSTDPSMKAGNYEIQLMFTYEYVDGSRRYESLTSSIQIPVTQRLSFILENISTRKNYIVGEEHQIYSPFANESKNTLYNVRAELLTDLESEQKVYRLGNLSAGESSETVFVLSSRAEGTYPLQISYSYENAAGQKFSETTRAELTYVPAPEEEDSEVEPVIQYVTALPTEAVNNDQSKVTLFLVIAATVLFFLVLLKVERRA